MTTYSIDPSKTLGPQLKKIHMAVRHLWPDGVPDVFGARERDRRIAEWLRQHGLRPDELPNERTIRRYFRSVYQG